jgi:tetratricopeptide (TPR) repeat protein
MNKRVIVPIMILVFACGALLADQSVKGKESASLKGARISIAQGNWDKALGQYQVVLEGYPNNIESLAGTADIYLEYSRNPKNHTPEEIVELQYKALDYYQKALAELAKPENAETSKTKIEEQNKLRDRCEKNQRATWGQLFNRGIQLYNAAQYDDAITLYTRLLNAAPQEMRTYTMMAAIYQEKGDEAKQMEYLQKAADINPKDAGIQARLGYYFFDKQQYAEALASFQKASTAEPDSSNHYFNIALCYSALKDSIKAFDTMKHVVEKDPKNVDALIQCSNYAYRAGDQNAALEYNRLAAEAGSTNPDVYMQLCFKYYKIISDVKKQAEPLRQKLNGMKTRDPGRADVENQIKAEEAKANPYYVNMLKYLKMWLAVDPTSKDALGLAIEATGALGDTTLQAEYQQRYDAQP